MFMIPCNASLIYLIMLTQILEDAYLLIVVPVSDPYMVILFTIVQESRIKNQGFYGL